MIQTAHRKASTAASGFLIAAALTLTGCAAPQASEAPIDQAQQAALTPDAVLSDLMEGNERYVSGVISEPNITERVSISSTGQYPQAVILSCLDSRVPVEMVFDQGIGDVFVGRVAGNVATTEQIGSMEFATKVAGSKLVMVLGHEACGAVKGACDGVELGNLTDLLAHIEPAVEGVDGFADDQRNSKNSAFVEAVVHKNVELVIADIRERSEVLTEMENNGEIKIVGAVYSLQDGSVTLTN
ncbi:carbonic anhydrase family protein [Algisphaera agarilytica]|uniref:Carbonic anhydrase n=1 Tax=Algisphaera agarilytica TaxID=1385975 RepID=A0A7X0LJS3_9BACT|nr:carbonic anhydrase family protein [Algisphaera agarilytica]MBB6428896.1 carbonic anhydrase [Algisphaera agarilytica]